MTLYIIIIGLVHFKSTHENNSAANVLVAL